MNQDKPAHRLSDDEIDALVVENTEFVAERYREAGTYLTEALRLYLGSILDKEADVPPEVDKRLREWIALQRIENLVDWLNAKGWAALEATPAHAAKVEAVLVKAAAGMVSISYVESYLPAGPMSYPLREAKLARAFLNVPRNSPRPELGPEYKDVTFTLGLDGLKEIMTRHLWVALSWGLARAAVELYSMDWLRPLAGMWLKDQADREETRARALPLVIQPRNLIEAPSTGAKFLRFPSMLKDAGAWCGALVAVDVDTIFAEEPDMAAAPLRVLKDADGAAVQLYKPRAWTVAATRRLAGPRQMVLPGLTLDPQRNPDLGAFLAVTATGAAVVDRLPGLCAKLLPLLFALCPLDGTPVKGSVQDLVKLLYPDWRQRRQMAGDVVRVGAAAAALRALRIVEALPNRALRVYPVTAGGYYDIPTGPGQTPEACLRLNPELADLATPTKYKGDFVLVNLSRLMDLDAKSPDRIAVALRLAAYWHTCKQRTADGRRVFLPDRVDFIPVDDLLVTINAPGRAADVIAGEDTSPQGKRKLNDERAHLVDEILPALSAAGLVGKVDTRRGVQRAGGAWMVKAAPPADYLEASRKTGRTRRNPPRKPRKG